MSTTATSLSRGPTGAEGVAWELGDLYRGPDDPRLEADMAQALSDAKAFRTRFHGQVAGLAASELADAVAELEEIQATFVRAESFAFLHFATDTADPARGALLQRVQEQSAALSTEVLFFGLEWVAAPEEHADAVLADPAVERFRHFLASARRYRPYLLSEPEETLLAEKALTSSSAWARLFTELSSALRIPAGDGEPVSLEEALSRLQQPDRDVRRATAEAVSTVLSGELRTRSYIFNTLLLDKATEDRRRGYESWIAPRNLSNEASDASVQALIDAVIARYDIPQRFYKLKARLLGLETLADYDRMAPILATSVPTSWDEARDIVMDAYTSFSPVTGAIVGDFFERSWIDAAVRPNKQPGAFCATTIPGVHPYVLLSFTGERRSVLTLAHELGHGVHGVLAGEQGLINAQTPLTLAETASVFGEALVFGRLVAAESDPGRRLELLVGRLEDAIATIFRQVAMNRFEDAVHTARRSEGELAPDRICELWIASQRAMLGDSVELTDGYRMWWSYIPHFIGSPGYVYAYAFGYLFSLAIFQRYQQEGPPVVGPYLDLLRAGGSDAPETLAKIVGLDLADPGFWAGGLEAVDQLLAEAEALAAETGKG
ncbi:MAG TPA: M3 family oligoendopeptidase [Actinomycetota bacterium]|nr:M3 family oligoendopeptidase [Actinomycetota bacterium]